MRTSGGTRRQERWGSSEQQSAPEAQRPKHRRGWEQVWRKGHQGRAGHGPRVTAGGAKRRTGQGWRAGQEVPYKPTHFELEGWCELVAGDGEVGVEHRELLQHLRAAHGLYREKKTIKQPNKKHEEQENRPDKSGTGLAREAKTASTNGGGHKQD